MSGMPEQAADSVSIFIPCIVEELYPAIGAALVTVLETLGFNISYDSEVFCCGQPGFSSGCADQARDVAKKAVERLSSGAGPLVVPSGSCTAMLRVVLPELFAGRPEEQPAGRLAARTFEISEFLSRPEVLARIGGTLQQKIGFHNSCHSAREVGISGQVRAILGRISGLEVVDIDSGKRDTGPACCGFGGVFSARFATVAGAMARSRLEMFAEAGVQRIITNDPGCIMHMRQNAERLGLGLRIDHLLELLAEAISAGRPAGRLDSDQRGLSGGTELQ